MLKIKSFLRSLNVFEQKHNLAHWLMAAVIVTFLSVSFFSLPDRKLGDYPIFNSPDETANYLFSRLYAKNGKFVYDDMLAVASAGYILPRSMQVVFSRVVPTAFIGLPLIYGSISKIIGVNWMVLFTPIIMALALLVLYWSLWVNFDKKIAWLTVFLIAINPAWLYSATRPMMTTGLFVSLVLLALACYFLTLKYQRTSLYALTGAFVGLALLVRVSEIIWLLPLAILLIFIFRKKTYWLGLIISLICVLPSLALIGTYNYKHFASPWQFGYNSITAAPSRAFIKTIIFPFGFNLAKSWQHFYEYTYFLFPCWTALSIISLLFVVYLLYKKNKLNFWIGSFLGLLLVLYLIIYYGSWTFFDNPRPGAITIGSSYVRYFLPVMLLSAPLIAILLTRLKNKITFIVISIIVLFGLTYSSYQSVWLGADEGVRSLKITLAEYKIVRGKILQLTPASSIIIAGRMDKAIYPLRRVYSGVTDWKVVAKFLFPKIPAYLLSKELSTSELAAKRDEIKSFGLQLEDGVKLTDTFFLYQVVKTHDKIK